MYVGKGGAEGKRGKGWGEYSICIHGREIRSCHIVLYMRAFFQITWSTNLCLRKIIIIMSNGDAIRQYYDR